MMVMATTQRRCGSPVTGAASCPDCQHQDGGGIPSPPSPRAAAGTLRPAASPSMESGSSPTLCLWSAGGMCPGRVQPGYSSWEAGTPAAGPPQSCSPPPPTPQQLTSVCHMIPGNNCVASHCEYSHCYHLHFQLCLCHRVPGPGRGDWRREYNITNTTTNNWYLVHWHWSSFYVHKIFTIFKIFRTVDNGRPG